MNHRMDDNQVERLRQERSRAVQQRGILAGRLAAARQALHEADARGVRGDQKRALQAEYDRAVEALRTLRYDEVRIREGISKLVSAVRTPEQRIAELDTRYPIALFPVRIETRFRTAPGGEVNDAAGELLVRVYPDGILAQTHEPLLTEVEAEGGRDYWRRVFQGISEQESWAALLTEADATRAAWIVEVTTPENLAAAPDPGSAGEEEPRFPEIETRPPGWHRAPESPALPDRWIVSLYRGGERVGQYYSAPVQEGLALALRLSADAEEEGLSEGVDLSGDGLEIAPELRWVYDFDEAVRAGMGIRLPLSADDLRLGFDQVLVAGLRTTEDPEAQAGILEGLFEGHRLSRGWEFVPQGLKTNNSQEAPSDYPPADPAGSRSFEIFRGTPRATEETDGQRFATALGIDPASVDRVAGAERDEQTPAAAMADALWPATLGYFLDQMMSPHVSRSTAQRLRSYMRDHVRPRGPYPAFRIGAVPYGLLPVGSLTRWEIDPNEAKDPVLGGIVPRLQRLERIWSQFLDQPPHVGRSDDPDADIVETLGQDASAQMAQIRRAIGPDTNWNLFGFTGTEYEQWRAVQQAIARGVLQALGDPGWDPRVLHMSFAAAAYDFSGPLVQKEPLSEQEGLPFDYIAWLRTATIEQLRNQAAPPTDEPLNALLYLMLRHAILQEYDNRGIDLLAWRELATPIERMEAELVGILPIDALKVDADVKSQQKVPTQAVAVDAVVSDDGLVTRRTAWDRFDVKIPGITEEGTVGTLLTDLSAIDRVETPFLRDLLGNLNRYRENLQLLEGLPSAELERLFSETLDSVSHRIDPWITSLFARRLERMRTEAPRGMWTGCYGWVHDLRPDPEQQRVPVETGSTGDEDNKPVTEMARVDSGGYVYAPSMLHGATAAVLRSAFLTRSASGEEGNTFAVDLSSRRTRTALELIDAVRAEQPLGAALGYRFERGLHEGHPGVELDRFIDEFRRLYPLVANKTEDTGEPAETVAARNVVDGLRLREAWLAGTLPWGTGELPASGPSRTAIEAELKSLDDAVDAVSDLLLAESVHQVLRGSTAGAGASLDSLAKGHRAPDPEVARTPRGGGVLHQRVMLVLSEETLPPEWAAVGLTARAQASPELNAWLAGLLGSPAAVACTARMEGGAAVRITMEKLEFQPIDLLAYAAAADAGAPSAELDRRVAWAALDAAGSDAAVTVDYEAAGPGALSLAEALELLAAVGRAIGFGRPLTPADLIPPERESALEEADLLEAELAARADAAYTALQGVATTLETALIDVRAGGGASAPDLAPLRAALVSATDLGIHGAFPGTRFDNSAAARESLLALGDSVATELVKRVEAAAASSGAERLQAIFGRGFTVMPRFRPAGRELLEPALASEPDLGTDGDAAVEKWFAGAALVQEPLDAWRQVMIYSEALGHDLSRPRIVQLPLEGANGTPRWAALPHDSGSPHRSGLVSIAAFGRIPAADAPWCGIYLDGWPEILPNPEEEAGVVFHYDAPGVQAPQAVLLAVPNDPTAERWSWEDLEATLLSTFDLARIRAVDLTNLGWYGQALPTAYLAANTRNAAIATSFVQLVQAEPTIVPTGS